MSLKRPILAVAAIFAPGLLVGSSVTLHNNQVNEVAQITSEALSASPAGKSAVEVHPDLENLRIDEGHGLGPNSGVNVLKFDIPGATCEVRLDANIPASRLTLQRRESIGGETAESFCIY